MSVAIPIIDYIDGPARRIYLLEGVDAFHWVEDIYREYINRRSVDTAFRKWSPFMVAKGNESKGGGKYTPRYITLLEGARVIPFDENILITVTGEAITDNADIDPDPFDTSTRVNALKLYITPPAAEIVRDVKALEAIAHMEFNGGVYYDVLHGVAGTGLTNDGKQIGTLRAPSNNFTDVVLIAQREGFNTGYIIGDALFDVNAIIHSFTVSGGGRMRSVFNILDEAQVDDCTYANATITGVLDGASRLLDCRTTDLLYVDGEIEQCLLSAGTITASSGGVVRLLDCWTDNIETLADVPVLDMGGAGQGLLIRNLRGGVKIINKTGPEWYTIILNGGKVVLDLDTVTNGQIRFEGVGGVWDTEGTEIKPGVYGDLTVLSDMLCVHSIASAVWEYER